MGGDRNTIHLLTRRGADVAVNSWPAMSKDEVAAALVTRIAESFGENP
jgi:phosphopantothenoylcysteine decarboxylase/phosphopantothenate--cysteine ligase